MIRKEVEKLRGYTFTDEELNEVIHPILAKENKKVSFFKEDIKNLSNKELQDKLNELIASGLVDPDTTIDDVIVIDKEYMKTLQEKQKEMFEMLDSLSSHCKEVYIYFRQPTEVNVFSILKDDDGKYFSYDETFVFNEASTAKESVKNLCLILSSAGIKTEILFNKCDANVSQHLSTLMSSILTN